MEEWIGGIWHKYITRKASTEHQEARIHFDEVGKAVGVIFRALGGEGVKRVEAASPRDYAVRRSFLQKIAGENQQVSLAWQDDESLRLPESIAVFPTKALNKDLYIWLAVMAANHQDRFSHWATDNQALVISVLEKFPSLKPRYDRLAKAFVESRIPTDKLPQEEQAMEKAIVQAVLNPGSVQEFPEVNYAPQPVFLWLYPSAKTDPNQLPQYNDDDFAEQEHNNANKGKANRKKAERVEASDENSGMMIFRLESMFTWSEFANY